MFNCPWDNEELSLVTSNLKILEVGVVNAKQNRKVPKMHDKKEDNDFCFLVCHQSSAIDKSLFLKTATS
jgi:hypothetical protein